MKLHNQVQNEAVLSNVGEIGEFRIRNSAKAFNILSSGLYANKIRAIVRELSCNAVDSHVAAGNANTPFDVHLPNSLEPYFFIRDYGTGLSHEQVTNIYTTYFESTKTASNDFIGALGLGSKSPFSYTDNFTVTAIKDGRKGIYTAFINDQGVPSIALMAEEATDEPAGVEVKFSVNDRYDFDKFRQEARNVYTYFVLKPNVMGSAGFEFHTPEYESRDIIPGVHAQKGARQSVAIMGNIAYPIDIPRSERGNGPEQDHFQMLNCGLEMHFAIGELDFQASREGLSYIPETIKAIEAKLAALNNALAIVLAKEADAIENLWSRAMFLVAKREHSLWSAAVTKYVTDTNLSTVDVQSSWNVRPKRFIFKVEDLAKDYNITVRAFSQSRHNSTMSNVVCNRDYSDNKNAQGQYDSWLSWHIGVSNEDQFIINDTKVGATQRAKDHFRARKCTSYSRRIYVIEPTDRTKPVKTDEFFKALVNPPKEQIHLASSLDEREREKGIGRNVSIMVLEKRNSGNYRRRDDDMVWRECSVKASSFDPAKTYYYVPLSGYQMQSTKGYSSGKEFYEDVTSLPGLFSGEIYGVRKSDIEAIKLFKNWVNIEEHISKKLNASNSDSVLMSLVRSKLDNTDVLTYTNNAEVLKAVNANSPYAKFVAQFKGVDKVSKSMFNIERLFKNFAPNAKLDPYALTVKYQGDLNEVNRRYPLLTKLNSYRVNADDIAEYINLVDDKKGL